MNIKTEDRIVQRVAEMLDARSQVGVKKYKEPLHIDTRTLSEWITMAQEELLDGANYLEKIKSMLEDGTLIYESHTCDDCDNKCKDCTCECECCIDCECDEC